MFTSRVFKRITSSVVPKANMATAKAARDGVFKEKSFNQTWLQDKGAYPCMFTIAFGVVFCTIWGTHYLATAPDVRLVTGASRSRMFRTGELTNEYIKENVDICKQ